MNGLVTLHDGQLVTTTLAIADGTDTQHKNVLELVRKYQSDMEEFGGVAFEARNSAFETPNSDAAVNRSSQGRPTEFAILNEQQSTLLLTYMRNSEIVRAFKKRLVRRFYEMAQELRGQTSNTGVLKTLPAQALKLMPDAMKAAKAMGFKGNQAILSANKAVKAIAGVNVLELMGQEALPAPDQDSLLTVSDIAKRLEWAVRSVNPRITLAGLQDEHRDHKNNLYYELTDLGHGFGVYLDTGKKHSDGTPVRQIKWRGAIVDYLRNHYADEASAA